MGDRDIWGPYIISAHFFCKHKTAIKIKSIKFLKDRMGRINTQNNKWDFSGSYKSPDRRITEPRTEQINPQLDSIPKTKWNSQKQVEGK